MSISINDVIEIIFQSGYLNIIERVKFSMTSTFSATKYMTLATLLNGISHYPIHERYRFKFWDWALRRKLSSTIHGDDPIGFYLSHIDDSNEANCLSSGQLGEIMRDVGRTFPEHPIFTRNGPGEVMLANILKATVSLRPDLGYCQGMNFVVGALLIGRLARDPNLYQQLSTNSSVTEDAFPAIQRYQVESDIFWATQHLLANSGEGAVGDHGVLQMESIWSPGFPKMKIRVYQFDRLFKWTLPELHSHCENILLSTEVMVSQWFMTLFSYMFPLEFTHHIWDYIFISGWPGVFKVTLAILYTLSDKLMDMDLEQVGLMIRDWKRGKFSLAVPVNQVLQSAEKFIVTIETLNTLQEGYALEIIRAAFAKQKSAESKLRSTNSSSPSSPSSSAAAAASGAGGENLSPSLRGEELEDVSIVYKELVELELQVEKDKEVIQKKILAACEACEATTTSLHRAIQEEAIWIEKSTEIKFELEKWSTKVTTLVSVIHGIDETEQKISAAAAAAPNPQDSDGIVIGQIGLTESVDGHDYDDIGSQGNTESLDDVGDGGSSTSSTIEEEHARLAEEYEEEYFGYEDENESVESSPSSMSLSRSQSGSDAEKIVVLAEDEEDVMNALGMLRMTDGDDQLRDGKDDNGDDDQEEKEKENLKGSGDEDDENGLSLQRGVRQHFLSPEQEKQLHQQHQSFDQKPSQELEAWQQNGQQDVENGGREQEQEKDNEPEREMSESSPMGNNPSPSPNPTRGPSPGGTEPLSVIEKMKLHPNRRRIVGIVQNASAYRNSGIGISKSQAAVLNPIGRVGPLDDPSIIANSLLRARNQSQESVVIDNSEEKAKEEKEKREDEEKERDGEVNVNGTADQEQSHISEQFQQDVKIKVDASLEAAAPTEATAGGGGGGGLTTGATEQVVDPKNPFSAFRFSSKIREGLDIIYRATSNTPTGGSGGGGGSQASSSNSLLALAEKERRRWMKRKNGSEISSASNSNSKETKGGRRMQFPNHLGLLGRERLMSNRKKNQMVKECRKLQLKVAKLTRALDVANRRLRLAQSLKMEALMADEESKQWKESLCHQFQLLVEDSTRSVSSTTTSLSPLPPFPSLLSRGASAVEVRSYYTSLRPTVGKRSPVVGLAR